MAAGAPGWILRLVVAGSFLILPHVVTTSSTIVDNQYYLSQLQAFQAAQPYVPSPGGGPVSPAPQVVIDQLTALQSNQPYPGAALPTTALAAALAEAAHHHLHPGRLGRSALPPALRSQVLARQAFQPVITGVQANPDQTVPPLKRSPR